ncbi:hypothetical protein HPB48_022826 [Haemaphysalis longicornis]|uniref:Uncharacterized protein n=1 Tax=Haemaphysalis longicornis TaxID=44386 RepID=A0A9J6GKQ0_HAELO|nr:hypothetical protein HPB48_022826 [Haemaphysalis longicornis]
MQVFPWRMPIIAYGYCAVWFAKRIHGHHLKFVPLDLLATKFSQLQVLGFKTVSYIAKGVMEKVATMEHNVVVSEFCDWPQKTSSEEEEY